MKLNSIIKLNLQRFKNRKLRVFLTVLGVGVGISIVYFLIALAFGIQELVVNRIVTSQSLLTLDVTVGAGVKDLLSLSDDYFTSLPETNSSVIKVLPQKNMAATLGYGDLVGQSVAYLVQPDFFGLAGVSPMLGELYTKDNQYAIVVTSHLLKLFKLSPEEALGKDVDVTLIMPKELILKEQQQQDQLLGEEGTGGTLSRRIDFTQKFTIIGIVDAGSNYMYMPLGRVPGIDELEPSLLKVQVADQDSVDPLKKELQSRGYSVSALTETLDQLNQIFGFTQIMFTAVGIIALFISAVGMFNTLTISLLERTREVGIMKAIGATSKDIWGLFLFDSILIGFLGGMSGLLLGFFSTEVINYAINMVAQRAGGEAVDLFSAPLWFIALVVISSFVMGAVTGFYPARRASKIDPLDALRYE